MAQKCLHTGITLAGARKSSTYLHTTVWYTVMLLMGKVPAALLLHLSDPMPTGYKEMFLAITFPGL